jgi:hypothetical protein
MIVCEASSILMAHKRVNFSKQTYFHKILLWTSNEVYEVEVICRMHVRHENKSTDKILGGNNERSGE